MNVERRCTNVISLVVCSVFVTATLGLVFYCGATGSIHKLLAATDDCGNICGELNQDNPIKCDTHDMRKLPKLLTTENDGKQIHTCIEHCPENYTESFSRCAIPGQTFNDWQETAHAFLSSWHLILLVCFVAFVFSYICLLLYRYCAKYVIWIINFGFLIGVFGIGTIFLTNLIVERNWIAGISLYVVGIVIAIIMFLLRKHITLVAEIFRASSKALMDVPEILFEPIFTFFALLISFALFIFFIIVIEAARKTSDSSAVAAARIINVIAFIWFTQFIFGCQHFVIAGTVGKWYFSRFKDKVGKPVQRAFWLLVRFHLGSICLGSILLTLVKILKLIVYAMKKITDSKSENFCKKWFTCCCLCVVTALDKALQYLVRNAYIIVALKGLPFFSSGMKAFEHIKKNFLECYSVNQFGDLVLVICRLLITLIAGFLAYKVMSSPGFSDPMFLPMVVSIFFALLIAHCFVTVFEMTVDTIFICYCVDIQENGTKETPYFMSRKLKKIMQKLKGSDTDSIGKYGHFGEETFGLQGPGQPYNDPYSAQYGNMSMNDPKYAGYQDPRLNQPGVYPNQSHLQSYPQSPYSNQANPAQTPYQQPYGQGAYQAQVHPQSNMQQPYGQDQYQNQANPQSMYSESGYSQQQAYPGQMGSNLGDQTGYPIVNQPSSYLSQPDQKYQDPQASQPLLTGQNQANLPPQNLEQPTVPYPNQNIEGQATYPLRPRQDQTIQSHDQSKTSYPSQQDETIQGETNTQNIYPLVPDKDQNLTKDSYSKQTDINPQTSYPMKPSQENQTQSTSNEQNKAPHTDNSTTQSGQQLTYNQQSQHQREHSPYPDQNLSTSSYPTSSGQQLSSSDQQSKFPMQSYSAQQLSTTPHPTSFNQQLPNPAQQLPYPGQQGYIPEQQYQQPNYGQSQVPYSQPFGSGQSPNN